MNKMIVKLLWLVMLIGIPFIGCNDKTDQDFIAIDKTQDFIVFGNIYGECTGDCREVYLMDSHHLYQDAGKNTELRNTLFLEEPLSDEKYNAAFNVRYELPLEVMNNTFDPSLLIDYIADFDYYIYGQVSGVTFELTYDTIDSLANPGLYQYTSIVSSVLQQIR